MQGHFFYLGSSFVHYLTQVPINVQPWCRCRGARRCYWSTSQATWPAPSRSARSLTLHPSTTSSWWAATASTSSTSCSAQERRSTSQTPTAHRRNPPSTCREPLTLCVWLASTWWWEISLFFIFHATGFVLLTWMMPQSCRFSRKVHYFFYAFRQNFFEKNYTLAAQWVILILLFYSCFPVIESITWWSLCLSWFIHL